MSGKRKEIFDGIMDGAFTTRGLSIVGPPGVAEVIFYQILFNIKMHIVKIDGKFSGTYSFNAYPLLLNPGTGSHSVYPGLFRFFHPSTYLQPNIGEGASLPSVVGELNVVGGHIQKEGELKIKKFGNNAITIEFVDIPQDFMVIGTGTAIWYETQWHGGTQTRLLPLVASRNVGLGFFSPNSPYHFKEFTLSYSPKLLGFQAKYNMQQINKKQYPFSALDHYQAEAVIVKTESYYSVSYPEGPRYVKQEDLTEVRQIFLDNPQLADQMAVAAEAEIREAVSEGFVSEKLLAMLKKPEAYLRDGDTEGSDSLTALAATRAKGRTEPRPREALKYAIEQLLSITKGANYCMTVAGDGWVNLRYKKSKDSLYFQVAGNKYIAPSKLEVDEVKKLETLGITEEPMSDDIFSTLFDDKPRDVNRIVDIIFEIFTDIYHVDEGSDAYIEIDWGTTSDATKAATEALMGFLPKRRSKNQFYWDWSIRNQ